MQPLLAPVLPSFVELALVHAVADSPLESPEQIQGWLVCSLVSSQNALNLGRN